MHARKFPACSVGIATGYVLDGPGLILKSARFSLLHSVQIGSGAQLAPYQLIYWVIYPGVKRPDYEAKDFPLFSI
jgi:hypothetical protein